MRAPTALQKHPIKYEACLHTGVFRGVVDYVFDGDTLKACIDKGHGDYPFLDLRLRDVRCAEVDGADKVRGAAARDFLLTIAPVGTPLLCRTYKASFDRFVADVWLYHPETTEQWVEPGRLLYLAGHSATFADPPLPSLLRW